MSTRFLNWVVTAFAALALGACTALPGGVSTTRSAQEPSPSPSSPAATWSATVGIASRPVVIGNTAFFAAGPTMTAVDLTTGAQRWQIDLTDPQYGAPYIGPPAVLNGSIIAAVAAAGLGGMFTFNPIDGSHTGTLAFHRLVGDPTVDGPLSASTGAAYGSGGPFLETLNFTKSWFVTLSNSGSSNGPITISGGRAFLPTSTALLAFDPAQPCTPAPQPIPGNLCSATWSVPITNPRQASFAGRGRIAVADGLGTIHVLDAATGAMIFTTKTGSNVPVAITGTVAAANGTLLFTYGSDGLVRSYPTAGCGASVCSPSWTGNATVGGSFAPVVANGQVYVANSSGYLIGFPVGGCGYPNCLATTVVNSGTARQASTRPIIKNGFALVRFANEMVAFRLR